MSGNDTNKIDTNKEKTSFFPMLFFLLPILIKASPLIAAANLVGLLHGIAHGLDMFVSRYLFDAVAAAAGSGTIESLIVPVIAFGSLYVTKTLLNGVHNFLYVPWKQSTVRAMNIKLSKKCAAIEPVAFENPDLLDDINKAKEGVDNAFAIPSLFLTMLTFYLPFFIVSASFLFSLKPLLLLLMLAMFLPAFIMLISRTKLYTRLEDKSAPIRRKYEYFESAICGRDSFKETRLFGAFAFFKKLYYESLLFLNKEIWKTEKKTVIIELLLRLFMLSGYFSLLAMLFYYLLRGEISVGSFAAVFSSLGLICNIIEEIVVMHLGSIAKDIGKVQNLVRFLKMPERHGNAGHVDHNADIELKNATFRYPGAAEDAVRDISLTIPAGETLAIVGENGAGKTTLVRLICGVFLPISGQVLIGGRDTSDIAPENLYENTSAVFQTVQRYQMTLFDNITLSDSGDAGTDGEGNAFSITASSAKSDKEGIEDSLRQADLELDTGIFPDGLDTMLSREFDGVDLSGGQWQRVSIARGLHRKSAIILLDEPTAAIDPIEEAKTYERFAAISKGKTSIIVTHRMGSVKVADRILVMDKGCIDDIGTHDELLKKDGLYARMWQTQSKWYE